MRAILYVTLVGRENNWGLGLWVELDEPKFDRYRKLYSADGSLEPRFTGKVANALKAFPGAFGSEVEMQLGPSSERPSLWYKSNSMVDLALAQQDGLTDSRLHALVGIERPDLLN